MFKGDMTSYDVSVLLSPFVGRIAAICLIYYLDRSFVLVVYAEID